ncbi:MAG TPA: type IV pilus secretin family protein, partial [bacterium]|nr:type IV pilus secretin family protein [bacterium]
MKSLRLSFVLLLIFSAVTVSATVANNDDCLFCVEIGGRQNTLSNSPGESFYELIDSKLGVIRKGEPVKDPGQMDILKGTVKGEPGFMFGLRTEGLDVVFETKKGGGETVRVGEVGDIVKLSSPLDLRDCSVRFESTENYIRFTFTEQPDSIRFFPLHGPDRLVFDFIGVKGTMARVPGIRYANHPSGFRVVVEKDVPKYFSLKHDKSYKFNFTGEDTFASFKEMEEKPVKVADSELKPETESVVQDVKEEQEKIERVEITGFAFVGEDPEILMVKAEKPFDVNKKVKGNVVEFIIKDAIIPSDKEQVIDASSLNGPVSELAIFNDDNSVKIIVQMQSPDFEIDVQGTSKSKEFVFGSKKQKIEAVAGYSEAQIVRVPEAATGQTDAFRAGPVRMEEEQAQYRGQKINLDFKDVDILDVLRLLADISKLNIIAGDDVKGTVTVRLVDIPWDEALDVILKSKSLGKERFGNIIRVAHMRTLQREQEAELAKRKAEEQLEPIKVRLIAVNYAMANTLIPQIKELLSERGT